MMNGYICIYTLRKSIIMGSCITGIDCDLSVPSRSALSLNRTCLCKRVECQMTVELYDSECFLDNNYNFMY